MEDSDYWYETCMFWHVAHFAGSWEERGWEFVWSNKASFFCAFRVKTARSGSRNRTEAIMGCMEGWLCIQAWLCGYGGHGNCLSPELTNLLPSLRNTNQNQRERERDGEKERERGKQPSSCPKKKKKIRKTIRDGWKWARKSQQAIKAWAKDKDDTSTVVLF